MYDLSQIKQRINCVDIARRCGLPITKPGDRCVSPLRPGAKNKTSFTVYTDFWYDFGGGHGGDCIDLLAELNFGGDRGSAIRELARITNIPSNNETDATDWRDYTQNLCNRTAHYHESLTDADREYLYSRGLTDADISRLMIGRVTDTDLRGRLFLPYFHNGAVVYYATRALPDGAYPESKYRKQKTDDFCQHVPWGLQTLTRNSDTLVIAEGYFDAASFEVTGYPVLSAVTGHFSKDQLPWVLSAARKFKRVLIVYDNDAESHAGEGFTFRMADTLFKNRIPFVVGRVPAPFKDVSEYFAAGHDLANIVDSTIDGITFVCERFEDVELIKKFVMSVGRTSDPFTLASLFQKIKDANRFTADEIKSLYKMATSAPGESFIADEIIAQHNIIFINNVGFYEWDGKRWVKQTDITIQNYADKLYGKLHTNAARVANVCKLLKARTVTDVEFDRAPVLTFQNGTLEIDTGVFRDFSENDFCSIIMDYDYDPDASCPTWTEFIETVTDGDSIRDENLQFIAGYTLFPNCKHQKVFVLHGGEGAGKSVYIEVLQKLFGDSNCTHLEPNGLTQEFQRILLKDSLLNLGTEIKTDFSQGSIREWLISVADGTTIQACYKGMTHVNFVPRCKLIYACNSIPNAAVADGLGRRLSFIQFPCSFVDVPDPNDPLQKKKDIDLLPRLLRELPGIFNWAYIGYKTLKTVGYFTPTREQDELLGQFKEQSNPLITFCDDCAYFLDGERTRSEVYNRYREWCVESGHQAMANTRFFNSLKDALKSTDITCEDGPQRRTAQGRVRTVVFGTKRHI